jgi:hypothetical protein
MCRLGQVSTLVVYMSACSIINAENLLKSSLMILDFYSPTFSHWFVLYI